MTSIMPLVAGNWKMFGLKADLVEMRQVRDKLAEGDYTPKCDIMFCPPATLLGEAHGVLQGSAVQLGGQNCHGEESGAHTGDVSAEMLKECGASAVIVGHSERRMAYQESDEIVRTKAHAAHRAGLKAIICLGESEAQRKNGETLDIITSQLKGSLPDTATQDNTIIAYEPIWAIGTGLTPTAQDIAEVHKSMRATLIGLKGQDIGAALALLYGGSVKPGNAAELMAIENVNGALVGGASLKAQDFLGIIEVYR